MGPSALKDDRLVVGKFIEMLAQATARLAYPSGAVAEVLAAPGRSWSIALDGGGGELVAKVGLRIGDIPVYKHVHLRIDERPSALPADRLMLPVSWEAAGGPPIFPKMEGTVHVEPDGQGTKITLNALYDPPFGPIGQLLDRAVMHRLAQITLLDFVERLASAIATQLDKVRPDAI
jgi:hypothetical protein